MKRKSKIILGIVVLLVAVGGTVVGLDGLPEQLLAADIVLSSTSSPHPIVGRDELGPRAFERRAVRVRHARRRNVGKRARGFDAHESGV